MDHFLRGLNELIPDNLLGIFDENELEVNVYCVCLEKLFIIHITKTVFHCSCFCAALASTVWRICGHTTSRTAARQNFYESWIGSGRRWVILHRKRWPDCCNLLRDVHNFHQAVSNNSARDFRSPLRLLLLIFRLLTRGKITLILFFNLKKLLKTEYLNFNFNFQLQSTLFAWLRVLRSFWEVTSSGNQRGHRRFRHDLNDRSTQQLFL